jgi:hypothetical protein
VRIVTNTPVGVFRTIVILPGRLDVVVVHRFLRQTSTCGGPGAYNEPGECGLHLDQGLTGINPGQRVGF